MKRKLLLNLVKSLKGVGEGRDSRRWPSRVLDVLEARYHLQPGDLLRLGYVRCRLSAGGFPVDCIYIYDRAASREQNLAVSSYRDLSRNRGLLLFKGSIQPDGSVCLEKVRAAATESGNASVACR